jgi:hypothetical protein
MAILFAALSMVFAFLIRSKVGPGADPVIHDERITDDRFIILIGLGGDSSEDNVSKLSDLLSSAGARGVTVKDDVELSKNY